MKGFLSKRPRLTVALAVFFALQIALALWFLPEAARRIGVRQLASLVDATVQIEDVDLNLFTRRARITNLSIVSPEGGRPLLHLPKVEVKFSLLPLFRGLVVLRSINFFQPRVFVERLDGNRFNLVEVIRPQGDEPGGVDLAFEQLEIQAGEISFVDRTLASASERVLKDVRLKTGKISTSPALSVTPTSFNLRLDIGAGTLAMTGSTAFLGRATGIELAAQWKNLNPAIFAPYLPPPYQVDFSGSFLSGEARYLLKHEGEKTVGHLLTASAELGPFRLLQPQASKPDFVVTGLKAQNASLDFLTNRLRVGELALAQPNLLIEWDANGQLNLTPYFASNGSPADLSEVETKGPKDSPPVQIEIQQARIEDGTIEIKDPRFNPVVSASLEKLRLSIENLAFGENAPAAKLEADAHLNEGLLRISGTLRPQPLAAQLSVEAQRVPFEPFRGYVDSALAGGRSRAGNINGRLKLSLAADQQDRLHVDIAGNVEAQTLALELADGSLPPVQAEKLLLEINRIRATPKLDVDIGRLQLDKADLRLERDGKGNLNLQGFWTAPATADSPKKPSAEASSEAAALRIRRLELNQASVSWLDRTARPEVATDIRDLKLTLREVPLGAKAKPGLLEAEGQVEKAAVRIKGSIGFEPLTANLSIHSKGLPLKPYRGYIDPALGTLETRDGNVSGQIDIALAPSQGDSLALKVGGKLEASELALGFKGLSESPFKAKSFVVDVARLTTEPALDVELSRIQIVGAELKVERNAKGDLNLRRLIAAPEAPQAPKKTPQRESEQTKARLAIGSLEVSDSLIEFADQSITPSFQTSLSDLTIKMGKATTEGIRTPISLRAKLDESAGLELKGWITPFRQALRVQLDGKILDYDLSQLNPYASKYIQYEIKRGRVTTDIEYEYDEGNLEGENEIAVRHLQLGNQLGKEFEQQVGISLKLALALLEDLDGRIRLQVPVSGNVNSPGFSIAGVVWKALRNALINFLTAPFRLLGNILTVGGKIGQITIDPAEFMPGSSELTTKAKEQLKQLAGFLKEKPRLEIELRGSAARREIAALKHRRLRREIKPKPGESYQQAVAQLYRATGAKVVPDKPPSLEVMENHLTERYVITDNELRKLANEREQLVANVLGEMGLERQRIFVKGDDAEILADAPSGRVEFELLY